MRPSLRYLLVALCVVGLVASACDDGGDDDNGKNNGEETTEPTGGTRPEEQEPLDTSGDPGGGSLEEYPAVAENAETRTISGRLGSSTAPTDDPTILATCEWIETDDGRVGIVASLAGIDAAFLFLISDEGFAITDQSGATIASEGDRIRVTGPAATHPLVPAGLTTGECGEEAIFAEEVRG